MCGRTLTDLRAARNALKKAVRLAAPYWLQRRLVAAHAVG
jgi:hypothetical protein